MSRRSRLGALLALALATLFPAVPAQAQQGERTPVAELRRQAEAGDRLAQSNLGIQLMLRDGDLGEARRWLRLAMNAGDPDAKNAYAGLLMNGAGGPRDEETGRRLILEAADEGSSSANFTLSMAYRSGTGGFPRDPARSFTHMQCAAMLARDAGVAQLQWEVGMMHREGFGTPADPAEAYRWVSRSADGGHIRGMISRAVMLATGEGVAEDDVAARQWYERAARLDDPLLAHAMRGLGSMLVNAEGGPADVARGIAYLRIAESGGDGYAPTILQEWASRITPEVDREATRIAAEWLAARPRSSPRVGDSD